MSCATELVKIIQGASQDIIAHITNCDDTPFDLGAIVGASALFRSSVSSSPVVKTLASSGVQVEGDAALGKLKVSLTTSDTALLYPGEDQDWIMWLDMGYGVFPKVLFERSITVLEDPALSF